MTSAEDEGTFLGTAAYNEDGVGFQTFELHVRIFFLSQSNFIGHIQKQNFSL